MNNLKRVLSLALSGIMLVGMMAMGASAAEFTDADKIVHDDAVNILVALKVINGQDDGSFNPEGDVTRAQMAKMIAVAMNGGTDTNTGVKTTPSFTDIKGHWAESYIEYCYDMGIISGRGDGTFDPDGNVTGTEATKMVLTALGYQSEAYKLQGSSWAVQTTELARKADPSLFEELETVVMANKASRDTAAQLIWNGLQNTTKRVTPLQNTNTGEVTFQYGDGDVLLFERYGAYTVEGTYMGNSKSISSLDDGFIRVSVSGYATGLNGNYDFPSTMGIENIGEEVRIVWKNGTRSSTLRADKNDTIYGVFNTGRTEVYNITKNDLQNASNDKSTNVKFDDTLHAAKSSIAVVTDYGRVADTTVTPTTINDVWRSQSIDQIKFTCDPDDGKIAKAYVTTIKAGKVSGVTSTKATITGLGTITIADHDVYDGIAKDDVVTFTQFFDSDLDDSFVTVTKAEKVEGALKGFKLDGSAYENVVVDGETYKVNNKRLDSVTSDAITAPDYTNIGDQVAAYLANGMVVALDSIEETGGKFALVIDKSSGKNVGGVIDSAKVQVLLADGTEQTLTIHKDSTKNTKATPDPLTADSDVAVGDLLEYTSISNGTIKIKSVLNATNAGDISNGFSGNVAVPAAAAGTDGSVTVWDKDKKEVRYNNGSSEVTAVAASDAVLFVARDTAPATPDGTIDEKDEFKTYSIRDLGNIGYTNATAAAVNKGVSVFMKDGLVKAAYLVVDSKPKTAANTTLYGIVSSYVGTREIDDTTYVQYKVAVNQDEALVINVEGTETQHNAGSLLNEKEVLTFDQRSDNCYAVADFTKLVTWSGTTPTVANATAIAVDKYDEGNRLLTYFTQTSRANATSAFAGVSGTQTSKTVDKDVKIIYINADGKKDGEAVGVNSFSTDTGYANALFTLNNGLVDVIIVETSNKVNWGGSTNFAKKTEYTLTGAAKATTTTTKVDVEAAVSAAKVETGETATITVKVTTPASGASAVDTSKTIKVAVNNLDGVTVDTTAGTNCTAALTTTDGSEELVITITTAATETTGTFVLTGRPDGNITVAVTEA